MPHTTRSGVLEWDLGPPWGIYAKSGLSPPPSLGGLDLNSNNSGCACLGSGVVPPLGMVEKEVAVLIILVRRHRCAVCGGPRNRALLVVFLCLCV